MKKHLLLLYLIIAFGALFGQGSNEGGLELPGIIPPSPTAYELGKYGQIPVGMFTGTPNINIPLYTYKTQNLSLPVSLSYNSNGIKVDQLASNTGLGWSLNAGGVISRITRDMPDDESYYLYPEGELFGDKGVTPIGADFFYKAALYGIDTGTDLFMYNFPGGTGKFAYDNDKKIILVPHRDIRIEPFSKENESGYIITDNKGIQYVFSAIEETLVNKVAGQNSSMPEISVTAWYLTKIVHPLGDEIELIYGRNNYSYTTGLSQSVEVLSPNFQIVCGQFRRSFPVPGRLLEHTSRIIGKTLIEIRSNNPAHGKITFVADKNHPDISRYKLISNITVTDRSSTEIERFDLNYLTPSNNRIFLEKITYRDTNRAYRFEYIDPDKVPERLSLSRDHWGYFNGVKNWELIPKITDDYAFKDMDFGANREPNGKFAEKGLLKTITWPTGGQNELQYEPNSYFGKKTLPVVTSHLSLRATTSEGDFGQEHNKNGTIATSYDHTAEIRTGIYFNDHDCSENMDIGKTNARLTIKNSLTDEKVPVYVLHDYQGKVFYSSFKPSDAGTVFYADLEAENTYFVTLSPGRECVDAQASITYTKEPPEIIYTNRETGGARIKKIITRDIASGQENTIRYYYGPVDALEESSGDEGQKAHYISGKKTEEACGEGLITDQATYKVLASNSLAPLFNTGNNNIYYRYVTVSHGGNNFENGGQEYEFVVHKDYPGNLVWGENYILSAPWTNFGWDNGLEKKRLLFKKGSHGENIPLKEVKNYYKLDDRHYEEVAGYSVRKNYNPIFTGDPTHVCTEAETKKVFIQKYCAANHKHIWSIGSRETTCIASGSKMKKQKYYHPCYGKKPGDNIIYASNIDHLDVMEYKTISYWHYLDSTTTRQYDQNGTNPVVSTTKYFYDNPVHLQVTRKETKESDGALRSQKAFYPDDIAQVSGLTDLQKTSFTQLNREYQHRISEPIQTEIYRNNRLLARKRTLYGIDEWTNTLPRHIQLAQGNNPLETRINFHRYGPNGEVREVSKDDGAHTTYLWAYNNAYPVAKIENAAYDEVKGLLGESVLEQLSASSDSAFISSTLNGLRQKLSAAKENALVTSLTHKPLIGTTSLTNPSGVSTYYEYDSFGRLSKVRDVNRDLVEAYSYHYAKPGVQDDADTLVLGIGAMTIGTTFTVGGYRVVASDNDGPSLGWNHVVSATMKEPGITNWQGEYNGNQISRTINYFDGLGRLFQTNAMKGAASGHDLVTLTEYDGFGRTWRQHLPLVWHANGKVVKNVAPKTADMELYGGQLPFAQTRYENSPLNRVVEQGAAGNDWQPGKHAVATAYNTNKETINTWRALRFDSAQHPGDREFEPIAYAPGTLYVTATTNENKSAVTKLYKNLLGQVVLMRARVKENIHAGVWNYDTWYVYDDFGERRAVIPPQADGDITDSTLCYYYEYDARGNMIEKYLPGQDNPVTMRYDKQDRLIGATDANGNHTFARYDALSRVTETGIVENGDSIVLVRNYYDEYPALRLRSGHGTWHDLGHAENNMGSPTFAKATVGRLTATEVKILGQERWITSVNYYDEKGRLIETVSDNHTKEDGIDRTLTYYDFESKTDSVITSYQTIAGDYTITGGFSYLHNNLLRSQTHSIDTKTDKGQKVAIAGMGYDNLNRLSYKYLNDYRYRLGFEYNIRNWLTKITSKSFSMELLYNDTLDVGVNDGHVKHKPQYNGNISAMKWATKNNPEEWYAFGYNGINHLTGAVSKDGKFNTQYWYDRNGNVLQLKRNDSKGLLHDFGYSYNGNQLTNLQRRNTCQVEVYPGDADNDGAADVGDLLDVGLFYNQKVTPRHDQSIGWYAHKAYTRKGDTLIFADSDGNGVINEADTVAISINKTKTHEVLEPEATGKFSYQYDAAGNMSYDEFKDVTIRYNHLNLPDTVIAPGRGKMVNTYLADGTLLTRTILDTNGNVKKKLDYCGELLIENDTIKYIFHSEGYAKPKNEKFAYFYILKDHLGNTRVVMDGSGKVLQEFAYYPFGMQIEELAFIDTTMHNPYEYSYNGKEEWNEYGLEWHNYGKRGYWSKGGRFFSIDPLAEIYYPYSPYGYCVGNPIANKDEDGEWVNFVVGAAIGAVVEYGTQATINLIKGESVEDALWNKVDFADVGLAAAEGALTSGGSVLRRVAITAGSELVKAAIDVEGNGNTDIAGTEGSEKSVTSVATDAALGTVTGLGNAKAGRALVEGSSDAALKSATSNVKAAAKSLTKANNAVKHGATNSKAALPRQAFETFNAAKTNLSATQTLNKTVGKVNSDAVKATVNVAGGVVGEGAKSIKDDLLK